MPVRLSILLFTALLSSDAFGATSLRPEQYQASYLVSFFRFVQWPSTSAEKPKTMRVCFIRDGAVYRTLQQAIINGDSWARPSRRQILAEVIASPEATQGCHILYLDAATARELWPSMNPPEGTLTVSDLKDFALDGGMVELRVEGGNLNFVFNQTRIQMAGLVVSAALSSLADRLEGDRKRNIGSYN